jgi:phage gp36-like protein
MSYANVADLILRYGEATITGLTDMKRTGLVDNEVAQQGLDDAAAEINGYIAQRYLLPLPKPLRLLAIYCCDIAVYRLATGKRQLTEDMVLRYQAAIGYLKLVAAGKAGLGVGDAAAEKPEVQNNGVVFNTKEKVFGRDSVY